MSTVNKQITSHFNSSEFQCECCGHVKIDERLIDMLEKILKYLPEDTLCFINSGYRCPDYDKKIGGFIGKHAQGIACDCKFFDIHSKSFIPSWLILCICQDLFVEGGFSRINDKSVHIDARVGSRYLGDEEVSNNSVTYDFYKYFNVNKNDVYGDNLKFGDIAANLLKQNKK